jgi:hypothetical protein
VARAVVVGRARQQLELARAGLDAGLVFGKDR